MAHRKMRLIGVVTAVMAGSMLVPAAEAAVGAPRSVLLEAHEGVVIVEGLDGDQPTTVEVRRDGVLVGTVTARPDDFNVPGALEINHLDDPTLCWESSTPAILPGDQVRVIGSGANPANDFIDTVDVVDFRIEDAVAGAAPGTVEIHGFVGGTPRPSSALIDVQLRLASGGRFFAQATGGVAYDTPDLSNGAWTATIDGLTASQVTEAVNNPLRLEADYLQAANEIFAAGPGVGPNPPEDPACPPLAQHAVTSISPSVLNIANQADGVTIQGVTSDASRVDVELDGADGKSATPTPGSGPVQTWSVSYTGPELSALEGTIDVTADHVTSGGTLAGTSMSFVRDTIRPGAPGISTPAAPLNNSALVTLTAPEPGASMFYTTDGSTPSLSSPSYTAPFTLTDSATVRAIAVDTAGNPGADPAGIAEQVVTIVKPPAGPGSLAASAADGQATLEWVAPANTNNGPVTGYTVRAITGGEPAMSANVGAGQLSHTFTGLTNGAPYTLSVLATNSAGSSEFVQAAPVMPQGVASQPTGVRGEPGVGSARVSWTPPGNNGGTPVTGYTVNTYLAGTFVKADSVGASQTTATIGGLTNGADYTFRVVASNAAGDSAESAASPVVTPQQRPARVRRVVGIDGRPGGRTTATVRWLSPRANTAELVRYQVRAYKVRRNGRTVLRGEAFSRVNRRVKTMNLRRGTYVFQVRAIGEAGDGRWSKRSGRVTAQ